MIYSAVLLVYIVATNPVQLRLVDRMPSYDICSAVIEKVKQQELLEPEAERIGGRLQCIYMSYKSDHDDDGPSKPVAVPDKPVSDYACRNPISKEKVACKEALYIQ